MNPTRLATLPVTALLVVTLLAAPATADDDAVRPLEEVPISLLYSGTDDRARFAIVIDGTAVRYRGPVGKEAPTEVVFELDAEAHADLFATFRRSGVLDQALDTATHLPEGALLIEAAYDVDGAGVVELRVEDATQLQLRERAEVATAPHTTIDTLADFCDQLGALAAAAHRRQNP